MARPVKKGIVLVKGNNKSCRIGSCWIYEKSYDRKVALGQLVYETGTRIINTDLTHL